MRVRIIAAALIRKGDEVLLICQQGPADPQPYWALPGGVVEQGETLTEALIREVREETGLELRHPGRLLYVCQMDNPSHFAHDAGDTQPGKQSIAFIFEADDWAGDFNISDPDLLVSDAQFFPLPEAIRRLAAIRYLPMSQPIVAHLRGEAAPGTVWLYRRQPDGTDVLIERLSSSATRLLYYRICGMKLLRFDRESGRQVDQYGSKSSHLPAGK